MLYVIPSVMKRFRPVNNSDLYQCVIAVKLLSMPLELIFYNPEWELNRSLNIF